MAVTFLIEGATPESLEFVASPIAEIGTLLHLLTDSAHHVPFRDLARRLREDLPQGLASELEALSPLWTGYRCRLLYPLTLAAERTIDEELDDIVALDSDRFFEAVVWAILGGHSGAPSLAAMRTEAGRLEIFERARARGQSALALAEDLYGDPARARARLHGFLRWMQDALGSEWRQVAAALSAEAQLRREITSRRGLATALTGLTTSSRLLSDPGRVVFDKLHHGFIDLRRRPLLALPSVYGWPHLLVKHEPRWPALVQYPLGPAVVHRQIPSADVLRRRLATLSDPSRIRVCRLLAREQLSTGELARRAGVSVPQMSRLLRSLRETGLLLHSRNGHFVLYRLNVEAISQLGSDLVASLLR
jgi:DNA-binding transcriptional ArsR family regulator